MSVRCTSAKRRARRPLTSLMSYCPELISCSRRATVTIEGTNAQMQFTVRTKYKPKMNGKVSVHSTMYSTNCTCICNMHTYDYIVHTMYSTYSHIHVHVHCTLVLSTVYCTRTKLVCALSSSTD